MQRRWFFVLTFETENYYGSRYFKKEAVIKAPCCGVYAHDDHLKMWLKNNIKCPNCHENLAKLLRGKLE